MAKDAVKGVEQCALDLTASCGVALGQAKEIVHADAPLLHWALGVGNTRRLRRLPPCGLKCC